jgi:hypothetical protein
VAAARHDHEAPVADVDDQRLVIKHEGVGLPASFHPGLLRREPGLVTGRAGDLSGDQHRPAEQEAGLTVLDHVEARLGQGAPAGGRDFQRLAPGQLEAAPAPEVRVDQHRQVRAPDGADQPVDARGVIEVAVAAHDGLDRGRVEPEGAHVLRYAVGAGARVEQEPVLSPVFSDGDQDGESVLRDERDRGLPVRHHRRGGPRDPAEAEAPRRALVGHQ